MILECPSCRARYLTPPGLFAHGARQVRCARCKHEWHATLPTTIDVFVAPPAVEAEVTPPSPLSTSPQNPMARVIPNLPAVIRNSQIKKYLLRAAGIFCAAVVLLAWPILDRQPIIKAFPSLRLFYSGLGLHVPHSGEGLIFDQVKSEIRYDSGTMKLYIDGVVHNTTPDTQLIPDIRARALGPDRHIIQSWWVEAPAATVSAGGDVPFHTEIVSTMQQTTEDVYLEFYSRDEQSDVSK